MVIKIDQLLLCIDINLTMSTSSMNTEYACFYENMYNLHKIKFWNIFTFLMITKNLFIACI